MPAVLSVRDSQAVAKIHRRQNSSYVLPSSLAVDRAVRWHKAPAKIRLLTASLTTLMHRIFGSSRGADHRASLCVTGQFNMVSFADHTSVYYTYCMVLCNFFGGKYLRV